MISRRKFLRFLPVAVAGVTLGVAVAPKVAEAFPASAHEDALDQMTMLMAAQKAVDPPLLGLDHLEGRRVHVLAFKVDGKPISVAIGGAP